MFSSYANIIIQIEFTIEVIVSKFFLSVPTQTSLQILKVFQMWKTFYLNHRCFLASHFIV